MVTVGFDTPNDTPERMRKYRASAASNRPGWYFVGGDATTMERSPEPRASPLTPPPGVSTMSPR